MEGKKGKGKSSTNYEACKTCGKTHAGECWYANRGSKEKGKGKGKSDKKGKGKGKKGKDSKGQSKTEENEKAKNAVYVAQSTLPMSAG